MSPAAAKELGKGGNSPGGKNMKKQWLKMFLKEQEQQEEREKQVPGPAPAAPTPEPASGQSTTPAANPASQVPATAAALHSNAFLKPADGQLPGLRPASQQPKAQPEALKPAAAVSAEQHVNQARPPQSTSALLAAPAAALNINGAHAHNAVQQAQPPDARRPANRQRSAPKGASTQVSGSQAVASQRHEARKGSASSLPAAELEPASPKARRAKAVAAAAELATAAANAQSQSHSVPSSEPLPVPATAATRPGTSATQAATHSHSMTLPMLAAAAESSPAAEAAFPQPKLHTAQDPKAKAGRHSALPASNQTPGLPATAAAEVEADHNTGLSSAPAAATASAKADAQHALPAGETAKDMPQPASAPPAASKLAAKKQMVPAAASDMPAESSGDQKEAHASQQAAGDEPRAATVAAVSSAGAFGSAISLAEKEGLSRILSDGRNESNAGTPTKRHAAQASHALPVVGEASKPRLSEAQAVQLNPAAPATVRDANEAAAATGRASQEASLAEAAGASIGIAGAAGSNSAQAPAAVDDSKSDDGALPPHMVLKKSRRPDAVGGMSSPTKPAAPLQAPASSALSHRTHHHSVSTDSRHTHAHAGNSAVQGQPPPLAALQGDLLQTYAARPGAGSAAEGMARQVKRRRLDDSDKAPGSSESDRGGQPAGAHGLGRKDKKRSFPVVKGQAHQPPQSAGTTAAERPGNTEPASTMASKSSSPDNEAHAGRAGGSSDEHRVSLPHGHAAAHVGRAGRLSDEHRSSSPHSQAAGLSSPGSGLAGQARRSSGSEDHASRLAGDSRRRSLGVQSTKGLVARPPGKPKKLHNTAGRPGQAAGQKQSIEKGVSAAARSPGIGTASRQPVPSAQASAAAAAAGERPTKGDNPGGVSSVAKAHLQRAAAPTQGRSPPAKQGKVSGTGMDKPQRPGIPDAARQGVGEGPSTSSQPTTAKFKSVPKEASGAFKAPSKAALLNPAAKQGDHPPSRKIASPLPSHASSTKLPGAKWQGKPGADRAGLAQTKTKPVAAPTSQAQPLKKHRISGDLPQAAAPAAAAAGQPHATSARPPATKPSHKRKAPPNDTAAAAAAAASRADVGGGSPSVTQQQQQQQQQKRRKPMPSANQPADPGSKLKTTGPLGAQPRASKLGSPNQPPAKHDAQAPQRPKAQQKLPAEAVPRGVAASSHPERPSVVAQEMVATSDPRIAESQHASGQGVDAGKPTSSFQSGPAGFSSGHRNGVPTKQPPVSPFQEPASDSGRPLLGLNPHASRPAMESRHEAQQKASAGLHDRAQQGLARNSERGGPEPVKDKAHASSRGLDGIPADLFTSSGRGQRQPLGVIDMVLFDSCRQLHAALRDRAHVSADTPTSLLFQDTQQDLVHAEMGQPWSNIVASACHLIIQCK